MKEQANRWFKATGAIAIDRSGLAVESNLQRYRQYKKGFLVRIDSGTTKDELDFLHWIKKDLGVKLRLSAESLIPGLNNLVVESWITGDKREHHLLDRPRNVPNRTALGAMSLTFMIVSLINGGNDIIATHFDLTINQIMWFTRFGLIILPPLDFS